MAIANEIGMEMARTAGQAPQMQIGTAAAQGAATGEAYRGGFQAQNKEAAAAQFQEVLNQGYQGMVQAFKSLAPEEQQIVGDPGMYQRSEDTMAAWWGMVAKAKKQTEQKAALATGTQQIVAGDKVAGNATLMQSGNITADQGVTNIEAANKEAKSRKLGQIITEEFNKPAPAATMYAPPPVDPVKSGQLSGTIEKMKPYMETISNKSSQWGVSPNLVMAMLSQESGGNAGAVSSTGVEGLMQVTNGTFAEMQKNDPSLTDRKKPEDSISAGTQYIAGRAKIFGGDVKKIAAAYNGGDKPVLDAVAKYGDQWMDHLAEFSNTRKAAEMKNHALRVERHFNELGGGAVSMSANGGDSSSKMQDMVMRLAKIDPDAPNHPLTKVLLDAMDKDADNAKTKHESNINAIREGTLKLKESNALQKRIDVVEKRVAPKLDTWDDFKALDKAMPGGLYGSKDAPGTGIGSKLWRGWLVSKEAGNFRTALAALKNAKLRIASGQTVTESEAKRMEVELGLSGTDSADVFKLAIQRWYEKTKDDYERDMLADPEASLEYSTRNMKLSEVFNLKPAAAATGKSGLTPEQRRARIAELEAKGN